MLGSCNKKCFPSTLGDVVKMKHACIFMKKMRKAIFIQRKKNV